MCSSTSDTFADSYLSLIFLNGWHFWSLWKPHLYLDKFLRVNEREWTRSCSELAWNGSFLLLLLLLLLLAGVVTRCVSRSSGIRFNPIISPVVSSDRARRSPLRLLSVSRSLNPTANTASIEFHNFRCHGNEYASCLFLKGRRPNAVLKAHTCC